jgi:tRNA uridine 5-carboxymethylaminomethyl modification enzyme
MENLKSALLAHSASAPSWIKDSFKVANDSTRRSAFDVLRIAGVTVDEFASRVPEVMNFPNRVRHRVGIEAVYAPYVAQQLAEIKVFEKDEGLKLSPDLDYDQIYGLSMHEKSILRVIRPESLGQARRIEGMTPAGCLRLLAYVQNKIRTAAKALALEDISAKKVEHAGR